MRTTTVPCERCGGTGQVAIVRSNDAFARSLPELCNRPMAVSVARARVLLLGFRRGDALGLIVRSMADRLSSTGCPDCAATGTAFTLTFGCPRRA